MQNSQANKIQISMKFHKVGKSSRTYVLEYEKASSLLHKRRIIPKKVKKMDSTQWKTKITVSHTEVG